MIKTSTFLQETLHGRVLTVWLDEFQADLIMVAAHLNFDMLERVYDNFR
jgi:hypothetical protein